jgi:hypothetical protein
MALPPARPAILSQVLGIVYRCIATHLIKKAGISSTAAHANDCFSRRPYDQPAMANDCTWPIPAYRTAT